MSDTARKSTGGLLVALAFVVGTTGWAVAQQKEKDAAPMMIQKQGAWVIGGKVLGDPGSSSLACDHGYVEYQIPVNPRETSLFMWHSSSAQVWETRWDGGDGYQSIFLRRGYPVYLWDGPRVGRANWSCEEIDYTPRMRDQGNWAAWRFGPKFGEWWPGIQFPTNDKEAWNQATRARYDEFDTVKNVHIETDAAAQALDKIGPTVALTNSAGGLRALTAATKMKTANMKGIYSYENVGFVFPDTDNPGVAEGGFGPIIVPLETFKKLTKFPIVNAWGDHTADSRNTVGTLELNRKFVAAVNKYGGHAELVMLSDLGLHGNTHIAFADMNNVAVADALSKWLKDHGLDKYGPKNPGRR